MPIIVIDLTHAIAVIKTLLALVALCCFSLRCRDTAGGAPATTQTHDDERIVAQTRTCPDATYPPGFAICHAHRRPSLLDTVCM